MSLLPSLRDDVRRANVELARRGLAIETFGNASAIARDEGLVVIKPSGVPYDTMRAEDLVVTDLDGRVVEGTLRPSSDLATHLVLYRAFPTVGGIVHTHSHYATTWAQAGRPIPCLGTTHADYFHGDIPITAEMQPSEIASRYEENTGHGVVRRFEQLDPAAMPAVLVAGHGSFCWGVTIADALHTATMLEMVAQLAFDTVMLAPNAAPISDALLGKHFHRKHGPAAYYGQSRPK